MAGTLREAIDTTTAAMLRARGSYKWTAPNPPGPGAAVAEMDFGAAPPILDALAGLSADAKFGYLPPPLADELAAACADFQQRRYGWEVDPALVHNVPDVLKALEIAITRFSRPGSPVILPTPAYMPFLTVPGFLGREIIQVRMAGDAGFFRLDLDAISAAFRAGGHLLIFCNPYNPLGRVFTAGEMAQLTDVVDRHGGLYGLQKMSRSPPARNAPEIASRSRVKKPASSSIRTWMISRPRNPGTVRNGM